LGAGDPSSNLGEPTIISRKMIFMKAPRIISAAVLKKDNKVLLVKEVLEDNKEHWIFPGGGVEFGETVEEAAKREMKEEVGLDVDIKELIGFKEIIRTHFDYHTVIFFFLAKPLGEEIRKIENVLEAKYFTLEETGNLSLVDSARWVLEEVKKKGIL
jgi:8-oxo-dGTP diphosphatase